MAASYSKSKGRSNKERYILIPHNVVESEDFLKLSFSAKTTLIAIAHQFNGYNNGDLSFAHSRALVWGFGSKSTLAKALKELMAADLIVRSRDPRRDRDNPHGQCSLYALTWLKVDECKGKHELNATVAPLRAFSLNARI